MNDQPDLLMRKTDGYFVGQTIDIGNIGIVYRVTKVAEQGDMVGVWLEEIKKADFPTLSPLPPRLARSP